MPRWSQGDSVKNRRPKRETRGALVGGACGGAGQAWVSATGGAHSGQGWGWQDQVGQAGATRARRVGARTPERRARERACMRLRWSGASELRMGGRGLGPRSGSGRSRWDPGFKGFQGGSRAARCGCTEAKGGGLEARAWIERRDRMGLVLRTQGRGRRGPGWGGRGGLFTPGNKGGCRPRPRQPCS